MWGRLWAKKTGKAEGADTYDKEGKIPVIRASICTGERVAGFKDVNTGKFEDLMLIRTDEDLKEFLRQYQVEEEDIRKEW